MRTLVPWAALAATLAAAVPRSVGAQAGHLPRPQVHGFGTWSSGWTSANRYISGEPGGDYRSYAFSVNASTELAGRLRAVAQADVERSELSEADVGLDYAFAEWRTSDAVALRAGQVKHPFGLSTEVFDVGTLRPFVALPQAVYGPIGFVAESYRGAGVTGRRELGRWAVEYDAYAGSIDVPTLHPPAVRQTADSSAPPTVVVDRTPSVLATRNGFGGRLSTHTPLAGLRAGVSAYAGTLRGENGRKDSRHRVVGAHGEYASDRWLARAELVTERAFADVRTNGSYVEAAYRVTRHWQGAVQAGRSRSRLGDEELELPGLAPLLTHEEGAVGVNYWVTSGFVVKTSLHEVRGNRLALPARTTRGTVAGSSLAERTRLLLVGTQFTF